MALGDKVVIGHSLDSRILEVFSNLSGSVVLCPDPGTVRAEQGKG